MNLESSIDDTRSRIIIRSAHNVAELNDETVAAMNEARAISEGRINAKSFDSIDALVKDLLNDVDDFTVIYLTNVRR